MSNHDKDYQQQQDQAFKFLKGVFGVKPPKISAPAPDLTTVAPLPLSAETPVGKNQPEFWADAPWRLEPDQNEIPLLFLVRDTNIVKPAKGPWRLDMLKIQQWVPGVVWEDVLALLQVLHGKTASADNLARVRAAWEGGEAFVSPVDGDVREVSDAQITAAPAGPAPRGAGRSTVDAGTYRFSVTADDGVRLWVDDRLLIEQWRWQGATTYTADLTLLREEFGAAIYIGRGIEICYQPDQMDRILAFVESGHFDLVLLSVHWMHDAAIHHRERWTGRTVDELEHAYLTTVREAAEMCVRLQRREGSPFHVLGHLDLVRRGALQQRLAGRRHVRPNAQQAHAILSSINKKD